MGLAGEQGAHEPSRGEGRCQDQRGVLGGEGGEASREDRAERETRDGAARGGEWLGHVLAAVRLADDEESLAHPAAQEARHGEERGGAAGAELGGDVEEAESASGHHRQRRRQERRGRA